MTHQHQYEGHGIKSSSHKIQEISYSLDYKIYQLKKTKKHEDEASQ